VKADEIRKKPLKDLEEIKAALGAATDKEHGLQIIVGGYCAALLDMMAESAAQLAEASDSLKRIANPLMVVDGSHWATFKTHDGRDFTIDRNAVTSVLEASKGVGDDRPKCVIETAGGGGTMVAGVYTEVCKKLGIPIGG
jgi:hypothetical protein